MSFVPRWYQWEAVDAIFDCLETTQGNPAVGLPTGTGKSGVIAMFIQRLLCNWPHMRVIVATHVKELVSGNYDELRNIWPYAPAGICSAGLKQRDVASPIIFGGIKTLLNCVSQLGWRDVLIVDEGQLLSYEEESEYNQFINKLKLTNPYLKIITLSATLWRSKTGLLTNTAPPKKGDGEYRQPLITHICYNLCTVEGYARLMAEGYLAPLIPKATKTELNIEGVKIQNGEFNASELEEAVDKDTYIALQEAVALGIGRHSWLVFCAGVKHAEHCNEILQSFGISTVCIHSKISSGERDKRREAWFHGEVLANVSMNIFTVGSNHPPLDYIVDLQPTLSSGKHVQKLGRGTRPYDGTHPKYREAFPNPKPNCLVADFARNRVRNGPINDPRIPKPGEKYGDGVQPTKICDTCGVYNHARAVVCEYCGAEFQFENKLTQEAGTQELVTSGAPEVKYYDVISAVYNLHQKPNAADSVKCSYIVVGETKPFSEWLGFENKVPYVRHRAHLWWKTRHPGPPPATCREVLQRMGELRTPRRIRVWMNPPHTKFPEVLSYEY